MKLWRIYFNYLLHVMVNLADEIYLFIYLI